MNKITFQVDIHPYTTARALLSYLWSSPACSHPGERKPRPPWLHDSLTGPARIRGVYRFYSKGKQGLVVFPAVSNIRAEPQGKCFTFPTERRTAPAQRRVSTVQTRRTDGRKQLPAGEEQEVHSGRTHPLGVIWSNVFSRHCQGCGQIQEQNGTCWIFTV